MGRPGRIERLSRAADALTQAVLDSSGDTPVELRRAAFSGSAADPLLAGYLALVDQHAYRVTDATLSRLRTSGLSDDGIFELTAAVALGAARRRLDSAVAQLGTGVDS